METVYLETTVVSYLVSRPSRDVVVIAHQQLTREWWFGPRKAFACLISDLVIDEAKEGNVEQAALRLKALQDVPKLIATLDGERLATAFLVAALPAKAARDAAHLAIATVGKVKYLLTWNCNHLANAQLLVSSSRGFAPPRN